MSAPIELRVTVNGGDESKRLHPSLEALVDFAMTRDRGRCFPGWQRAWVKAYITHHVLQGTLAFVRQKGAVVALGIGWQLNACETRVKDFVERPWNWQPTNPKGDAFFFADVIGEKRWLPMLLAEFMVRFPHWRKLRFVAIRRGKLVEYNAARLVKGVQ
jgi:hypothetical protein